MPNPPRRPKMAPSLTGPHVDHDRLSAWLGLPPGAWPPDHYALLGLARGTGDFAEIETRVLDRMDRLRQHQLRHPDAVTDGMNRLAQALVCLTDPVARAAYDRGLGIAPAPFEVVEEEPPFATETGETRAVEVPFEPGLRPPGEAPDTPYEVVWEPDPLPYEVVPDGEFAEELPPAFEVVPDAPASARSGPPPIPLQPRTAYRRLAALRRAVRAWEHLRPVLGDPSEALATPVAVLAFLRAVADARSALPGVAFVLNGSRAPGGIVSALARSPHAPGTIRLLQPAQRQAVALDWRRGYDALRRERDRLRELVYAGRARRRARRGSAYLHALRRTPEWALAALALVVLLAALIRRNP